MIVDVTRTDYLEELANDQICCLLILYQRYTSPIFSSYLQVSIGTAIEWLLINLTAKVLTAFIMLQSVQKMKQLGEIRCDNK
jgi:hypothetical protein